MALARNFVADSGESNQVILNWKIPLSFNDTSDELIVTRTISHAPTELYNTSFPNTATDSRPVEIFRGNTIVGTDNATISVLGSILTDTAASFPTAPKLIGRLLRGKERFPLKEVFENSKEGVDSEAPEGETQFPLWGAKGWLSIC